MYLRMKAPTKAALVAALKACGAGFTRASENGPDEIVGASHRHVCIHGLAGMIAVRAVKNQAGVIVAPAVPATGYHADLSGPAVTPAIRVILEQHAVTMVYPVTPQHVVG
jgi:hypothetical protein